LIVELTLAADPASWRACGLSVADDGTAVVGGTRLRLVPPSQGDGLLAWGLADPAAPPSIDGLATAPADPPPFADPDDHRLGAIGIDHVVIATPDLERTCAAITEVTGAPLRRVREVGAMRQGFHRAGELVVEVVTFPDLPPGPAAFWGLVVTVADLDAAAALLGPERIGDPKDAVQPGRRIATVRIEAGLGCRVALISPDPRR
jgi:catechol 2,3-dioxygenase-like lactoylglutathione lyase family enzyme